MLLGVATLVVELIAGFASNSIAVFADAGHQFADVSGLTLSLVAIRIAAGPRTDERTFGLYRLEILAATANALLLLAISGFVIYEGLRRLSAPPEIHPAIVVGVATFALATNGLALWLLRRGAKDALTLRAAYLEVGGDLLGAAAVFVAGVLVLAFGWVQADAIASIAIGVLIVPRAISVLRDAVDILLEASPKGVDLETIRGHILDARGVADVHDLHAWTITSGMNVVSAHVVLEPDGRPGDVLDELGRCLSDDFDINHSTFQLETPDHVRWEARSAQPRH